MTGIHRVGRGAVASDGRPLLLEGFRYRQTSGREVVGNDVVEAIGAGRVGLLCRLP